MDLPVQDLGYWNLQNDIQKCNKGSQDKRKQQIYYGLVIKKSSVANNKWILKSTKLK
jgi:hypothetical protein